MQVLFYLLSALFLSIWLFSLLRPLTGSLTLGTFVNFKVWLSFREVPSIKINKDISCVWRMRCGLFQAYRPPLFTELLICLFQLFCNKNCCVCWDKTAKTRNRAHSCVVLKVQLEIMILSLYILIFEFSVPSPTNINK